MSKMVIYIFASHTQKGIVPPVRIYVTGVETILKLSGIVREMHVLTTS